MRIYVGNLNYGTGEDAVRDLFAEHGEVEEVAIITDRDTGRPRGFAFVIMADDEAGKAAIEVVNGQEMEGRTLVANEARPRSGDRGGSGGYRGGS